MFKVWGRCGDDPVVYKHISKPTEAITKANGVTIALVWFEGDPEVWHIDGERGLQELKAYYLESYDAKIEPLRFIHQEL